MGPALEGRMQSTSLSYVAFCHWNLAPIVGSWLNLCFLLRFERGRPCGLGTWAKPSPVGSRRWGELAVKAIWRTGMGLDLTRFQGLF